jgi:hypothetical protein
MILYNTCWQGAAFLKLLVADKNLVPKAGLETARGCPRGILSTGGMKILFCF